MALWGLAPGPVPRDRGTRKLKIYVYQQELDAVALRDIDDICLAAADFFPAIGKK